MSQKRKAAWIVALMAPIVLGPLWVLLLGDGDTRPFVGTAVGLVAVLLLAVSTVTDLRWRKIPNWATYSAVLWAIAINITALILDGADPESRLVLGAIGVGNCIAGTVVCFTLMLFVYRFSGGGAGDVKLAAALGALLGVELGIAALIYSYIVAGVIVMAWAIWRLGPVFLVKTLGRKIAAFFLPAWFTPPTGEQLQLLQQPVPLSLFFALGTLPVLLGWDLRW
jgi:Flp pilus assembly protein protease CpaA